MSASQLTISLTTADLTHGWLISGGGDEPGSGRRLLVCGQLHGVGDQPGSDSDIAVSRLR
jgi:hypothetical protein